MADFLMGAKLELVDDAAPLRIRLTVTFSSVVNHCHLFASTSENSVDLRDNRPSLPVSLTCNESCRVLTPHLPVKLYFNYFLLRLG
jgi:hypothetical protein